MEVLISVALLSLVLFALFKNLNVVKSSTLNLHNHLEASEKDIDSYKLLYLDLLQMQGDISIISNEKNYDRACFFSKNSIYNLPHAYICWVVSKNKNTLLRLESTKKFSLPTRGENSMQKDIIRENIEIFKLHKHKKENQILVFIKDSKELSFKVKAINKIIKPPPPKKPKPKPKPVPPVIPKK